MLGYWFSHEGQRVVVDVAGQVVRAELDERAGWREEPPDGDGDEDAGDDASGIRMLEAGHSWPAPMYRSAADAGLTADFTPLFALAIKGKAIDDHIYAAVEQWLHEGAGSTTGCYEWLAELRAQLEPGTEVRGLFDAAAHLAGEPLPQAKAARLRARKWLAAFLRDKKQSTPVGIYEGSERLSAVFRHDRLLQSELSGEQAAVIRTTLSEMPALRAAYQRHLAIITRLTGPWAYPTVLDTEGYRFAVVPPSESPEGRLLKELLGATSVPDDFELGPELVARIRDGRLPTRPGDLDGWYAYQFHANAALLAPETRGLEVGERYRKELEETFQALFALTRETHVKQLEVTPVGGVPLIISPRFTVEPVPAYYQRVGEAYRFLRCAMQEILGDAVVCGPCDGLDGESLFDCLAGAEMLFHGASIVSRRELGQRVEPCAVDHAAVAAFRSWQRRSERDEDLRADIRVAAPVFYDVERKTVRICATVGVETRTLGFEFVQRPEVTVHGTSTSPFANSEPVYDTSTQLILSPITIECDVRVPPTREELRRICDRHGSVAEIREALEGRG